MLTRIELTIATRATIERMLLTFEREEKLIEASLSMYETESKTNHLSIKTHYSYVYVQFERVAVPCLILLEDLFK